MFFYTFGTLSIFPYFPLPLYDYTPVSLPQSDLEVYLRLVRQPRKLQLDFFQATSNDVLSGKKVFREVSSVGVVHVAISYCMSVISSLEKYFLADSF